jgi:hypothetical protein
MQSNHYSQLYRRLRDLDPHDYQRVIRTYEEREDEIGRLDVLEHFELTVYYVDALFQTGAFRQHQLMVDLAIETGIRHNIVAVEGISGDIFQHLLFHKAAAAFRLRRFDVAIHVARELVRIDAGRELYVRFLRIALFKEQTATLQFGRAGFIFCILLAAFLVTINLLVVTNFYPMYVGNVKLAVAIIFAAGVGCLGGAYGLAYWRAHRTAYRFQGGQLNK